MLSARTDHAPQRGQFPLATPRPPHSIRPHDRASHRATASKAAAHAYLVSVSEPGDDVVYAVLAPQMAWALDRVTEILDVDAARLAIVGRLSRKLAASMTMRPSEVRRI